MNAPFPHNDNTAREYVHDDIVLGEDPGIVVDAALQASWRRVNAFDAGREALVVLASLRPINGGGA